MVWIESKPDMGLYSAEWSAAPIFKSQQRTCAHDLVCDDGHTRSVHAGNAGATVICYRRGAFRQRCGSAIVKSAAGASDANDE
jgi:hypothetical protein